MTEPVLIPFCPKCGKKCAYHGRDIQDEDGSWFYSYFSDCCYEEVIYLDEKEAILWRLEDDIHN